VRRDLIEEALRLFFRYFDLFTLIALTVWLPGHLAINYADFFAGGKGTTAAAARSFRVALMVEGICGPLVVAGTLAALLAIRRGQAPRYLSAMRWAFLAWPRLFVARLVVSAVVLAGFVLLVVPGVLALVRLAFVDSLVVIDDLPIGRALSLSNRLTAGRRWGIFWAGGIIFVGVFLVAATVSALASLADHFVVQVMADCLIAVTQTVFTITMFVFYWEARRQASAAAAPSGPGA